MTNQTTQASLSQAKAAQLQTVGVRYIGSKPKKNDNITGSDIVWNGFGDIQQVPLAIAHRLLVPKYKDIWQNADDAPPENQSDAGLQQKAAERAKIALKAHQEVLDRKKAPEQERAHDVVDVERVIAAIGDLASGEKPEEHFNPDQTPKLESVRAALGKRISKAALTEAWDRVIAAQATR